MSELATETPTAPTTVESVISASIASLPGSEASEAKAATPEADISADTSAPPTPETAPQVIAPTLDEIDSLVDAEMGSGHTKKPDNRIPYSRTRKIIEKAKADWAKAQEEVIKGHTDKLTAAEQRIASIADAERIMGEDPDRFIQMLGQVHPRYRAYTASAVPPASQPGQTASTATMPEPDKQFADGSATYSPEGLQKLLEWNAQQVEQRVAQRFQPLEQERQSREAHRAASAKVTAQLEAAAKRPMFKENEAAILKTLQDNPTMGLMEAYQEVVLPKLTASRDTIYREVLAELKAKPHSTSVTTTAGAAPRDEAKGPRDMEQVIRDAIKGLK